MQPCVHGGNSFGVENSQEYEKEIGLDIHKDCCEKRIPQWLSFTTYSIQVFDRYVDTQQSTDVILCERMGFVAGMDGLTKRCDLKERSQL